MINYYELLVNNPEYFKQFSCKELLFLNYDCPVKPKKVAQWSEHNYIYYVLSGKKTLHTVENSITITNGSIGFIKKGACIVEQFYEEAFCVVVFIMPDSFIRSFLNSYAPLRPASSVATPPVISLHDDEMIRNFYQSIIPYFVSADNVPDELLELKFKELLLHMLYNPANEELHNYFLNKLSGVLLHAGLFGGSRYLKHASRIIRTKGRSLPVDRGMRHRNLITKNIKPAQAFMNKF